ncbi:DUF2799 domain-containing protein [Photobacterium sp. MCCC 1A19761]|uniref:DUF2799 domain-containing protein n=1 Tax=Photobacterium sp. MCCC 1A19761 TaxID=3115000 RepID=UPI00307F083D
MFKHSLLVAGLLLVACVSSYEAELSQKDAWEQLGAYHGKQGYLEWDEKRLSKQGAMTETDYEEYRAGYLRGRYEYCSDKKQVTTVVNPGYPDDCKPHQGSYGLVERGY